MIFRIGDGETVPANTVQIQRCGEQGFSHNEINPTDQPQPFIQMWFRPEHIDKEASFELVAIAEHGVTPVYQSFDTQLSILSAQEELSWQSSNECLVFVYAGTGSLTEADETINLERGHLVKARQPSLQMQAGFKALMVEIGTT